MVCEHEFIMLKRIAMLKMQIIFYSYVEEERYHQKLFPNIWELKWKVPTDFLGRYKTLGYVVYTEGVFGPLPLLVTVGGLRRALWWAQEVVRCLLSPTLILALRTLLRFPRSTRDFLFLFMMYAYHQGSNREWKAFLIT